MHIQLKMKSVALWSVVLVAYLLIYDVLLRFYFPTSTYLFPPYFWKYKYTDSEGDAGNIRPDPAESHSQTLKLSHWSPCAESPACSTHAALSLLSDQDPSQHPHTWSWHLLHLPLSHNCLISVPRCCRKGWSARETWSSSATGLWSVCCSTGGSDAAPLAPHEHAQVFPQARSERVRKPPASQAHSPSAPAETCEERRECGEFGITLV